MAELFKFGNMKKKVGFMPALRSERGPFFNDLPPINIGVEF